MIHRELLCSDPLAPEVMRIPQNNFGYPNSPGSGIDFSQLDDAELAKGYLKQRIQGNSGNFIDVIMNHDQLKVLSVSETLKKAEFHSQVGERNGIPCITFDLINSTKDFRHPDFYGKKFYQAALQYFQQRGHTIRAVEFFWQQSSINYKQFLNAVRQGASVEDAAFATWSGKMARANGYTVFDNNDSPSREEMLDVYTNQYLFYAYKT